MGAQITGGRMYVIPTSRPNRLLSLSLYASLIGSFLFIRSSLNVVICMKFHIYIYNGLVRPPLHSWIYNFLIPLDSIADSSLISMGNSNFHCPPGFRFHPTDEELIVHYLQNKVTSSPLPASVIAEIDLYKYNPWELPNKALFGEDEWYFFTPRERKYPKGARPNRSAASGYWKATGTDKPILNSCGSRRIGVKKALVFYTGPPPKRVKTDWIMNEYRLPHQSTSSRFKGSMRLDDWVLCRVRQKGNISKNTYEDGDSCSVELPSYSPQIEEEVQLTSTDYNAGMIMDYPFTDCQLLPLILTGALPPIETISSLSFGGSNKGNHFTPGYVDGSNNVKSPTTVSSLGSYFRRFSEESEYENFLSNGKLQEEMKSRIYNLTTLNMATSTLSPQNPSVCFKSLSNYPSQRSTYSHETIFPIRQKVRSQVVQHKIDVDKACEQISLYRRGPITRTK